MREDREEKGRKMYGGKDEVREIGSKKDNIKRRKKKNEAYAGFRHEEKSGGAREEKEEKKRKARGVGKMVLVDSERDE